MPFRPTAPLLKKTSTSSALWLARQYKDPYVRSRLSNPANYRSRSAFKLLEVEARYGFLKDFMKETCESSAGTRNAKRSCQRTFNIVDLGAAPGGWSQVIAGKLGLLKEEPPASQPSLNKGKLKNNMAQWEDEMRKREKLDGMIDQLVDEEIDEMESLIEGKGQSEWSAPPSSASSSSFGLSSSEKEAGFDDMDPLDYLNSRDLDMPSAPKTTSERSSVNLVALDILPIRPISGVHTVQMDFLKPEAPTTVIDLLTKLNRNQKCREPATLTRVDLLLSDLSPPHTGNRTADVSHSVTLLRAVWDFARKTLKTRAEYHRERVRADQWARQDAAKDSVGEEVAEAEQRSSMKSILRNGGILVYVRPLLFDDATKLHNSIKHFAHPISTSFCRTYLSPFFSKILYFKPPSSRSDSTEGYWVCIGWKGVPEDTTLEQLEEAMQRDVKREKLKEKEALRVAKGREERERRQEKNIEMRDSVETTMQHSGRVGHKAGSGDHFIMPPLFDMRELTGATAKSADGSVLRSDNIISSEAQSSPGASEDADILRERPEISTISYSNNVQREPQAISIDWRPKP